MRLEFDYSTINSVFYLLNKLLKNWRQNMESSLSHRGTHAAFILSLMILQAYFFGSCLSLGLFNWLLITHRSLRLAILPLLVYHASTLVLLLAARRLSSSTLSTKALLPIIVDTSLVLLSEAMWLGVVDIGVPVIFASIPFYCSVVIAVCIHKNSTF